jgi:signal peptidase I
MQASAQEFLASAVMPSDAQSREQHKHILATEVLRTSGTVRLKALGHSMLPTLWPGDLLTIAAQSIEGVQVGDVVLFMRENRFFIHRVLRKDTNGSVHTLVTRGDAMPEADDPVTAVELLGNVVSVAHNDQTVVVPHCSWLRRRIGLMFAHRDRLRSLALRWHTWRSGGGKEKPDLSVQEVMQ